MHRAFVASLMCCAGLALACSAATIGDAAPPEVPGEGEGAAPALDDSGVGEGGREGGFATSDAGDASDGSVEADPAMGFTADFRAFLQARGYGSWDFARGDLPGPSAYGGRVHPNEPLEHEPVVFVHGNSDRGVGGALGGWDESLRAFRASGYRSGELYAFTWGPADADAALEQYHSREHLGRVRAFLEAVLAYTGAQRIDIIGHSMGVTLARKAIVGGAASDALAGGAYDLGPPLTARVDTFVGISGANLGLASCYFAGPTSPTCGATNGFYPGTRVGAGPVVGRSAFLDELLEHPGGEGAHRYAIWSPGDELLGPGALVWGAVTARLPAQDGEVQLDSSYGHMDSKANTADVQLRLVRDHDLP